MEHFAPSLEHFAPDNEPHTHADWRRALEHEHRRDNVGGPVAKGITVRSGRDSQRKPSCESHKKESLLSREKLALCSDLIGFPVRGAH